MNIIRSISSAPFFQNFRLVGGTALSLQLGHRMSIDADFFSNEIFDQTEAMNVLSKILPGFMLLKNSSHGFAGMHKGIKIDIYTWGTLFQLPAFQTENIRMAALPDISALKMEAIINRKEEKDFRDVHALLQVFSMAELISFFQERYPHHNAKMLTDHLLAAPFVERDMSISVFTQISWEQLSSDIITAISSFYDEKKTQRELVEQERLRQRLEALKKNKP